MAGIELPSNFNGTIEEYRYGVFTPGGQPVHRLTVLVPGPNVRIVVVASSSQFDNFVAGLRGIKKVEDLIGREAYFSYSGSGTFGYVPLGAPQEIQTELPVKTIEDAVNVAAFRPRGRPTRARSKRLTPSVLYQGGGGRLRDKKGTVIRAGDTLTIKIDKDTRSFRAIALRTDSDFLYIQRNDRARETQITFFNILSFDRFEVVK